MEYDTKYMDDQSQVAGVCNVMAKKGWRVISAMPMILHGNTAGIYVLFERAITPSRSSGGAHYLDR